jgi:heptosyltransferase-3
MNPLAPSFLFINVSRIGDTLLATPAIRAVAAAHPDAMITVLAHPKRADVIRELPFVSKVGTITKRTAPWRGRFERWRHDYALVYGFDEPLVAYALRVAERVVAFRQRDESLNRRLYRCVEIPRPRSEHAVSLHLRLPAALGVTPVGRRIAYRVLPGEASAARARLASDVPAGATPLIGVQAASFPTKPYRDWPIESFAELAARIRAEWPRAHFLIYGGTEERERLKWLGARLGPAATLYAGMPLRETAAIMSLTDLYIGVDTGPTHIMSAFDIPLVGLYHCLSPSRQVGPLEHPCSYVLDHPWLDGAACTEQAAMAEISVDAVYAQVRRALTEHPPLSAKRRMGTMRFGFVITNLAGGGAEKVILTLAAGLTRRGHEVEVVLLENRVEHTVPEGVCVSCLAQKAPRGWLGKRLLARRLRRHLARPPDMLISALPFANEVAILAGLPRHWCRIDNTLGVEIDKLTTSNPGKARRRLARYRRLYNSRPLIAISDGMVDDLREHIGITGCIEKIPNPFDVGAIRHAARVHVPGLPDGPYVVHVGRFNSQKRHDMLLDAWARLDTDRLLVLLTAPDPRLQLMVDARGLTGRVRIIGFQPNPYPWIAGADLLVLCSDHEGLPSVIIEALAVGTPVVSTDCPSGPREILGKAFPECLVPVGDVAALSQAISRALVHPPDPARADLTSYNIATVVAAYEHLAALPAFHGVADQDTSKDRISP